MVFADRRDAGERLAEEVAQRGFERPLVLALPRGGVPVGYEVARALQAPLDTLVARKIGAPLNPEWAVGALAPHDVLLLDEDAIQFGHISHAAVEGVVAAERKELERRVDAYRSGTFSAGYIPKTVVLVDDGVATGLTARAALQSARKKYPKTRIIFAAPVCLSDTEAALKRDADEVICLSSPQGIHAVGAAYEHFDQTSDADVMQYLGGDPPLSTR